MLNFGFVLKLLVMVRDTGVSGYMDFGSIEVTLTDVNDNGPVFHMVSYCHYQRSQYNHYHPHHHHQNRYHNHHQQHQTNILSFLSQLVHFTFSRTKQAAVTLVLFKPLM